MSTENTEQQTSANGEFSLDGLFAFKMGMASVYSEEGERVPVTVLKYEPWVATQVKTTEKEGYSAVQLACRPKKAVNTDKAQAGHLKKAGFENGAHFVKEFRQEKLPEVQVGAKLSINSLAKGDTVKVTAVSKGHGFAGVIKRHGHHGGPAAHGSKFHRRPGSMGNRTWPGRVKPGRKLPGHYGDAQVTVHNLKVVDILPEDGVVLVRGAVPGARNTLVTLVKE